MAPNAPPSDKELQNLLSLYASWRKATLEFFRQKTTSRSLKLTKDKKEVLCKMLDFCKENQISPVSWLNYLFEYRRWLRYPRFLDEDFLSTKALAAYRHNRSKIVGTTLGYFDYVSNQTVKPMAISVDPNKDIIYSVEALKRTLADKGRSEVCMNNTFATVFPTNGFHPKSTICQSCPLRDTCREHLIRNVDFDIIELRLGNITTEQAKGEAHGRRGK